VVALAARSSGRSTEISSQTKITTVMLDWFEFAPAQAGGTMLPTIRVTPRAPSRERASPGARLRLHPPRTRRLMRPARPTSPVPQLASQTTISGGELNSRPVATNTEILEAAPGLAVVQHSGSGKANQYYLRGYNLDHGTDLAIFWDDIPINLPTNAQRHRRAWPIQAAPVHASRSLMTSRQYRGPSRCRGQGRPTQARQNGGAPTPRPKRPRKVFGDG
jgi:hypothetical protein